MTYEKQPDGLPTNKAAVVAALAPVVAIYVEPVVAEVWPQIAGGVLAGPAVTQMLAAILGAVAALVVAWWVPDRAGVIE